MLPKNLHQHDRAWATQQLKKIGYKAQKTAVTGYDTVYKEAYDNEPLPHKKENAGRRAANTRLREFIERLRPQS